MKNREIFYVVLGASAIMILLYSLLPSLIANAILEVSDMKKIHLYLFSYLPSLFIGSIFLYFLFRNFRVVTKFDNSYSSIETNRNNCNHLIESTIGDIKKLDAIRDKRLQELAEQKETILRTIHEYLIHVVTPYLRNHSVDQIYNNILRFNEGNNQMMIPVEFSGQLTTIDIRHLGWNIGERLGWSGSDRAAFIKQCFPKELDGWEVDTIRRTLRQKGNSIIELDVPSNDSPEFMTINHTSSNTTLRI